jgi:hypothetical protein
LRAQVEVTAARNSWGTGRSCGKGSPGHELETVTSFDIY